MDRTDILRRLEIKLVNARDWRDRAKREFDANLNTSTAVPHSCGKLIVRESGREYQRAIEAATRAVQQHTDFIVKGIVPEDLTSEIDQ